MFYWEPILGMWEDEECDALLQMITEQWVAIHGFSYASAWMESHKQMVKKGVQKSKGIWKKLFD